MATKNQITYKVVGQNVKLIIDNEVISKRIADAEERKLLKERVIAYNKKSLVKEKKALLKEMSSAKEEAKAKKASKGIIDKPSKSVKQIVEKAPVLTMEEQLANAKKLLEDNNFTVNAKSTPSNKRYRGEH